MQYIKIGDLCNVSSSKRVFARQYVDNGIPFYRQKEVIDKKNGKAIEEPIYISESDYNIFKAKFGVPANGDLLITAVGATLGIPYFVGNEQFYFKDGNLIWLSNFKEKLNSKFLYYWIDSSFGTQTLWNRTIGSAQPALTIDSIKKLSIPVPSKAIQDKISTTLTTFDQIIENNNKRIKLLEQMAENLYKEWFVRFRFPGYEGVEFESGIPKGWEILRASQLFDITIGKTPDRKIFEYFSNISECNYPWISISDMRSASTFVFKTKEYLTINAVNTCNVKIIPKNTVIVSFKLTVGQVAITTSDMCTNEAIAHFTTDNVAMREYIYLYLKKFQYSDLGNTSSIGTAVNSKIIKNMKIILPSSELLNRFHDSVYSIFEEIRLLNETNNNLIKQRDMLLPRLMSGKLEV